MGLSGRKTKQRIPNDPRNLAWANDANKFGAAYLAKLGWDPSRGLGVSGEGRTKALTVNQKLDMLGIGADHKNSAEGMAWKQNKDFENLLRRLNAANGNGEVESEEPMKIDGFVRPTTQVESEVAPEIAAEDAVKQEDGEKKSKKKRKKGEQEDEGEERKKKRKKSKSSEDTSDAEESSKKDKKKKKNRDAAEGVDTPADTASSSPAPTMPLAGPSKHPRAAYRGRHMAAKSLASKSASAIAEILGLAPTPSSTSSPSVSGYPSSAPTPYPSTPFEPGPSTSTSGSDTPADADSEQLKLQELTVSSKSVMDYFKEKLAAKSNARIYRSAPTSGTDTPAETGGDDYEERPRMGLGASKLRMEITQPEEVQERRRGLTGSGSAMRSSFAAMFTSATGKIAVEDTPAPAEAEIAVEAAAAEDGDEGEPKKRKDKKRKERKKEKKSKKEKEKEKEKEKAQYENPETAAADTEAAAEKAERKRRKEEKGRRKEAEAQSIAAAEDANDGHPASEAEEKERKRKKDKKKSKADR